MDEKRMAGSLFRKDIDVEGNIITPTSDIEKEIREEIIYAD